MRREQLIETIQDRGDLDSNEAARDAAEATMRTLGERIATGEAEIIADKLSDELAGPLMTNGGDADSFSPSEFVDRVEKREETADGDVEQHVSAVLQTLSERLNYGEWRDIRTQLPSEYKPLYGTDDEEINV